MAQTLVNESRLRAIFTGLSTVFNNAMLAATLDYEKTCMVVPSTGRGMDYTWLSRFPRMRMWSDDKHVKALAIDSYYIPNQNFESTIAVDRNDIEDDQLGIYNVQAQMMGQSAGELFGIIANDLKNNGFTANGIDGVPFYGTHTLVDSNNTSHTYSNLGSNALSASTFAAAQASLGAGRIAIMKMEDSEGVNLGLMPDTLEVPPALEATARLLATSPTLLDLSPNPYQGTVQVIVNPGITNDASWFLHVTSKSMKPFIIQSRQTPQFVSQTSMENDAVFNRREFKYGVEARCAGAYGFWQLSYGYTA